MAICYLGFGGDLVRVTRFLVFLRAGLAFSAATARRALVRAFLGLAFFLVDFERGSAVLFLLALSFFFFFAPVTFFGLFPIRAAP